MAVDRPDGDADGARRGTDLPGAVAACERWFLRRGVPHCIAGYGARTDVLTRAAPALTLILVISVVAAGQLGWDWRANVAAVTGGAVGAAALWWAVNRLRGRSAWRLPSEVGAVEVGLFVATPALLQVVFGAQIRAAVTTVVVMVVLLGVVYLSVSYGVVPLLRWAAAESAAGIRAVAGLVMRALPLVLVVNAFLFINAEMWQVAAALDAPSAGFVVGLFAAVGTVFLLVRLPPEVDRMAADVDGTTLPEGTPAADLPPGPGAPPPLARGERRNLVLVLLVVQGLQVVVVSALVAATFCALGAVAVPAEVVVAWTGAPPTVLAEVHIAGRDLQLSTELVGVAVFLAGFSGLSFAVGAVTDATYREEFFSALEEEVRLTLAVRARYRASLAQG